MVSKKTDMNAGVKTSEAAIEAFNQVKGKKKDFVVFKINDSKTEVIPELIFPDADDDKKAFDADEKERKRESNFGNRVWGKFKATLTQHTSEAKFAVLDFRYIADDRAQDKLLFFFWCPEKTNVRTKMLAASTYQSFSAKLGVAAKLQVQDASDLDLKTVTEKAAKGT